MTNYKPILLELPLPLCQKHIDENPEEFIVKLCSGWSYKAIPIINPVCKMCLSSTLSPLVYLSRANLTGADLTGANLTGANLTGAKYSKFTQGMDRLTKEQKESMIKI